MDTHTNTTTTETREQRIQGWMIRGEVNRPTAIRQIAEFDASRSAMAANAAPAHDHNPAYAEAEMRQWEEQQAYAAKLATAETKVVRYTIDEVRELGITGKISHKWLREEPAPHEDCDCDACWDHVPAWKEYTVRLV